MNFGKLMLDTWIRKGPKSSELKIAHALASLMNKLFFPFSQIAKDIS